MNMQQAKTRITVLQISNVSFNLLLPIIMLIIVLQSRAMSPDSTPDQHKAVAESAVIKSMELAMCEAIEAGDTAKLSDALDQLAARLSPAQNQAMLDLRFFDTFWNYKKYKCARLFLARGAYRDQSQLGPLLVCTAACDSPQAVSFLLEHQADPNFRREGKTALEMALSESRSADDLFAIARLLYAYGDQTKPEQLRRHFSAEQVAFMEQERARRDAHGSILNRLYSPEEQQARYASYDPVRDFSLCDNAQEQENAQEEKGEGEKQQTRKKRCVVQ